MMLAKFAVSNPDGPGAALGKWCSQGTFENGDSSSGPGIPPQLCYQIVNIESQDRMESVISSWSVPERVFRMMAAMTQSRLTPFWKARSWSAIWTSGSGVRGQGSGGAVVNKTIAPKAHADDAGSDASTVINWDDSVSMVGPKGLGAPQARFTKRRPKTTSSAR